MEHEARLFGCPVDQDGTWKAPTTFEETILDCGLERNRNFITVELVNASSVTPKEYSNLSEM